MRGTKKRKKMENKSWDVDGIEDEIISFTYH